jgi:hypothetical protein
LVLVSDVITKTGVPGQVLTDALAGAVGAVAVMLPVGGLAQSGIINDAVTRWYEVRKASITGVLGRVSGVLTATSNAAYAIDAGDGDMASRIHTKMTTADSSGDWWPLMPVPDGQQMGKP